MTEPSSPPSGPGQLLEAFQEIGRSLEIGRTAETILAGLRHVLPACDRATLCAIGLDGQTVTCRRTRGRDSAPSESPASQSEALSPTGIARRVLDSGRPEVLAVTAETAASDPDLNSGSASAVATPLLGAGGRRLGALVAESAVPSAFSERDRAALASFAAGAAPAVERILFYEKAVEGRELVSELEVAGSVLHDLLPHECPALEGMEVAAVYEPCSQVGGDYYDLIPLGEDRWGFAVADVAGKGIPAALLVAALRASVFSLAKSSLTLRVIVGRTNQLLYESVGQTRYATFFFGLLDVPLRRLIHINAGHPPPILVRASGEVEMIYASGLPLGLFPSPRYFEQVIQLGDGDLLAFYTDGITESADHRGDLFGRERLADVLRKERDLGTPAAEVCDSVLKAVRRFRRGAPDDDQTVVVIRAGPGMD